MTKSGEILPITMNRRAIFSPSLFSFPKSNCSAEAYFCILATDCFLAGTEKGSTGLYSRKSSEWPGNVD
jgi:hypothetical protein